MNEKVNSIAATFFHGSCRTHWTVFSALQALEQALEQATPEIFNTDQGSRFTSDAFTGVLLDKQIALSIDGRGRAIDSVFVERLWWTLKYEDVYPKAYSDGNSLYRWLDAYFGYYNCERKHSALDKQTPAEVFMKGTVEKEVHKEL